MSKSFISISVNEKNFNEIKSGNKNFEFIFANKYWKKRIKNKKYSNLVIVSEQPKKIDSDHTLIMPYLGYEKQVIPRKLFDKNPVKFFVIRISISKKFAEWHEDLSKCMRANKHGGCYGGLWTCAKCKATVCYAEGTHSGKVYLDSLCDECWGAYHGIT